MTTNSIINKSQREHLEKWLTEFITINRERLQSGMLYSEIVREYGISTSWPVGQKTFVPVLRAFGLERYRKDNKTVYVLNV